MKTLSLKFCLIALLVLPMATMARQSNPVSPAVVQQTGVKTYRLDSKLMKRQIPYALVLPKDYETNKIARFPVIYLLHGGGGNYQTYLTRPNLIEMFQQHQVIVVTVEGGVSFYTDSATVPNDKYESYIVQELIPEVDKNFRTVAGRNGRAVAGISMGGYGAMKFGIKYPQLFALACSWSGGVIDASWLKTIEIGSYPPDLKDALRAAFGDGTNSATLEANDVMKLFANLPADKVAGLPFFYLDCGTEDDFGLLKPNRQLAEVMLNKRIAHEYREFPGGHNVAYPSRFPYLFELSDRLLTQAKTATNAR
jgi:S-formylglutathione hydrolase FrmB